MRCKTCRCLRERGKAFSLGDERNHALGVGSGSEGRAGGSRY